MHGMEKVYFDLDEVRRRLIRLIEMERLEEKKGLALISKVFNLMEEVNELAEAEEVLAGSL